MPFLQNHDQVGNRAMGERLASLAPRGAAARDGDAAARAAGAAALHGRGDGAKTPFLFFCDFHGDLAAAVRDGRRKEFAAFPEFADEAARARIPGPNAQQTFLASKIDWAAADAACLAHYTALLRLRAELIAPRLRGPRHAARFETLGATGVAVDWTLGDGSVLHMRANFGAAAAALRPAPGAVLHTEGDCSGAGLGPWSGAWTLETTP
jgi:maltooligosyltrehalose trehalohydrolase